VGQFSRATKLKAKRIAVLNVEFIALRSLKKVA